MAARAWATGSWPTSWSPTSPRPGFTHVELLPVAEHPFGGSWGYQVTSYYAPTARFGTPDDFRYFVDRLHRAGIGVIMDWVPAHFPQDEWALARFDGTPLYEHADPRRGEHPDWGTLVFDFGRPEVRNFLVANALYWLEEFHIDGLRVDAVASMLYLDYSRQEGEWLPNVYGGRENLDAVAFLQEMNATVYKQPPRRGDDRRGVHGLARASPAPTHLGGLGFGFKWNMGWMHDTLGYVGHDPVHRSYHHNEMTFSLMYAYSENFVLPLSPRRGGARQGLAVDPDARRRAGNKAANLRALLAYMWAHPGKQLLFMGGELGQDREWSEGRSLDWELLDDPLHAGVQTLVGDLNRRLPRAPRAVDAGHDARRLLLDRRQRRLGQRAVASCATASTTARVGWPASRTSPAGRTRTTGSGLPLAGRWREVLNTDAEAYGGSGVGNLGAVEAQTQPWHGRPASAVLQLPPAGVLWLVPETDQPAEPEVEVDVDAGAGYRQRPAGRAAGPADDVPPASERAEESSRSQ